MEAITEYQNMLQRAIEPFYRQPISSHTVSLLTSSVVRARQDFLSIHSDYTAVGEVSVSDNGHGSFDISAPVCTYTEKLRMDHEAREREFIVAQLVEDQRKQDEEHRKNAANMLRSHRKLMRLHAQKIPPSTMRIWGTLDVGQQYAILKDIDYAERHRA